jgi:sterol 24-C-methyltransferase
MEDHLYNSLGLPPGSRVLEARCGVGHVALRFARKGLRVYGIDGVENHVRWAEEGIRMHGQENNVKVRLMDYHHLDGLADESFDRVYTMETSFTQQILKER